MRACPKCGPPKEDPLGDFCPSCGGYLWDAPDEDATAHEGPASGGPAAAREESEDATADTVRLEAATASAEAAPSEPATATTGRPAAPHGAAGGAPPSSASLSLRLPDQQVDVDELMLLRAPAGGRVTLYAVVRNTGRIVDNYDLAIEGLPAGWWTIAPRTVRLLPGSGQRGGSEQEVEIQLHPPRAPAVKAGDWSFELIAVSRTYGATVARAAAQLTVEAYSQLDLGVDPQRKSGRRRSDPFKVRVTNRANAAAGVALSAVDSEARCRFAFGTRRRAIEPNKTLEVPLTVSPPSQIWIGRPLERRFEVTAELAGADGEVPLSRSAVFVQRPWLPWWLAIVVPLLAALLVLLLALLPERVAVPDLRKARTTFAAQKLLDQRGLKLGEPIVRRRVRGVKPGRIVDQTPAAGEKAKVGSAVAIEVAVGRRKRKVPRLVRLRPTKAEKVLDKAGLTLGAIRPKPDPNGRIKTQIPAAGVLRPAGTPVNVFLAKAKKGKGKGKDGKGGAGGAGGKGGGGAGAGGGGAAGAKVAVPDTSGATRAKYVKELSGVGLIGELMRRVIDTTSRGTVLEARPKPGAKVASGTKVKLVVSAGFPRLAFDDGGHVFVAGGSKGRPVSRIAKRSSPGRQPTWVPDGSRLVYRAGPRLVLASPRVPEADPIPITPADSNTYSAPAFAPTDKRRVLAFIRNAGADGDLCFARLRKTRASPPRCVADPSFDLRGPVSWSPRGSRMIVSGVAAGSGGRRFGLIRYASATPFSSRPADWGQGQAVTELTDSGKGVIAGAWAPDGERLALISNLKGPTFRVYLTKPRDFRLKKAKALPLQGCQLVWRPDSRELAVTIADVGCREQTGMIVRLNPSRPEKLTALLTGAGAPAWQPVKLGR